MFSYLFVCFASRISISNRFWVQKKNSSKQINRQQCGCWGKYALPGHCSALLASMMQLNKAKELIKSCIHKIVNYYKMDTGRIFPFCQSSIKVNIMFEFKTNNVSAILNISSFDRWLFCVFQQKSISAIIAALVLIVLLTFEYFFFCRKDI